MPTEQPGQQVHANKLCVHINDARIRFMGRLTMDHRIPRYKFCCIMGQMHQQTTEFGGTQTLLLSVDQQQ